MGGERERAFAMRRNSGDTIPICPSGAIRRYEVIPAQAGISGGRDGSEVAEACPLPTSRALIDQLRTSNLYPRTAVSGPSLALDRVEYGARKLAFARPCSLSARSR